MSRAWRGSPRARRASVTSNERGRRRKKPRTILGRVIRAIERKRSRPGEKLGNLMEIAKSIHGRWRRDKQKVYRAHEPRVSRIAKGKARKRYE